MGKMSEKRKQKILNDTREQFFTCLKGLAELNTNIDDFEKFEDDMEKEYLKTKEKKP